MSATVVIPSFRLRRDIKADRIDASDFKSVNRDIELTFTGPYTVTVNAVLVGYSDTWSLLIPRFSGTAIGAPVAVMTAILPEWVPRPADLASQSHPLNNGGAVVAGYASISQVGTVTLNTFTGDFAGVCGPLGDFVIQYSQ